MNSFSLHPNVYATGDFKSLLRMLENIWVHEHTPGQGTLYIISGFGTYNGGVRFFDAFDTHVQNGGRIVCFFAGSTAQRLTSRQLIEELLKAGAEVHIVNRKRLLHAKLYGTSMGNNNTLIVTSGNFTGPGLSLNAEAAILLNSKFIDSISFSWQDLEIALLSQSWDRHQLTLSQLTAPGWQLLYDEQLRGTVLDSSDEVTLLVTLGHSDTVRIHAIPRTKEALGSQYFWLSIENAGFFPPLTTRNKRGTKSTFSCLINMHYILLQTTREERVTFENDNNLDFRLGTGALRYTKLASPNDLAAISRTGEMDYELRIFSSNDPLYLQLRPFTVNFIGHRGKQFGYIDNDDFTQITGISLPSVPRSGFS